jgi:predicted RNA-binding protein YlqC (UPF0109 family)
MGEVRDDEEDRGGDVEEPEGDAAETEERSVEAARTPVLEPSALVDVLEYLARHLVEFPDGVKVSLEENDRAVSLKLKVDQRDMGKVIGRGGRTARALRSVMRAAGSRAGVTALVEIVEE